MDRETVGPNLHLLISKRSRVQHNLRIVNIIMMMLPMVIILILMMMMILMMLMISDHWLCYIVGDGNDSIKNNLKMVVMMVVLIIDQAVL